LDLLLASGERANLEIKQQIPNSDMAHRNCMRTLAALANSGGGIVLLGVADDGEVVGIEPGIRDRSIALLGNLIRSSIQPELIYELRTVDVHGRTILLIEVVTGTPPYRVTSMGSTVYVRTEGATTVAKS
jgi:predicted HTH transcriptional regulator